MKKKKNYLKSGILLLGISLLLWNCEKEYVEPTKNESATEQESFFGFKIEALSFNQALSENKFNNLRKTFKLMQLKNKTKENTTTDTYQKTIQTTDTLGITFVTSSIRKITSDNYVSYTMLMYEPNDTSNNFSNLIIQEKNGIESIFTIRYTSYSNKSTTSQKESTDDFSLRNGIIPFDGWDETGDGSEGGGNGFVEECNTVLVLEPFHCGCGHYPGDPCSGCGDPPYRAGYELKFKDVCEWVYVGSTGNTGENTNTDTNDNNPNGGGYTNTTDNNSGDVVTTPIKDIIPEGADPDVWFEEQVFIDDNFKNKPCLKSVYDAMGKATKFQEYLKKFESDASIADLRFSVDDNFANNFEDYTNAMAIANPPLESNIINIVFNTDPNTTGNILDKPDVFKAVAMIHELLHAEMYRKMLDALQAAENNQTTLDWSSWTRNEFQLYIEALGNKYSGILDFFTRFKWKVPEGQQATSWQHQQMAEYYRDIIKEALTDYDPTLTEEQKDALSWLGLDSAEIVAWQNLTPDERTAIDTLQFQIQNTFPNGCN